MFKAVYSDKQHVVFLLTQAFKDNRSVNYVIGHNKYTTIRLYALMEYSFDMCFNFGEVYLSDNRAACALLLPPKSKRTNLCSVWLDIKLIFHAIGIGRIGIALKRESAIKELQYKGDIQYLWFIGVDPAHQHKGLGTILLNEILAKSDQEGRPVCLETSTLKNLPWYENFGFEIYGKLDLGYELYFLKRDNR
ncbi:Acetyltransferase (GNAT) family protein [Mucilaginibacter pineti]|uniref:Acetyltransferase (GNAT) family protein n=1 Tax=Mucilaginibacter pineti TaxID=1391627 RepID=A0A1G7JPF3_9SPHI|nr:GNAT family N-acetyltransferase [Mucilaginibacter pineti]SDF26793.1 Acetyltransferase (GNAT) family protein [Mucilaginibacter pineti]